MDDDGGFDAEQISEGPPTDVLVAGGKRGVRPRGRVVGGVAAVLTLIAGGIVAISALSGDTGVTPESLVPATSFAFARIDLDPPSDQASALGAFAGRFPSAKSRNADELREHAISVLIRNWHLDYAKDVKPWLGGRAAVAGFPDSAGKSKVVFVLQTKDADAAKAALAKLPDPPAVEARSGYVVLAQDSTVLNAALSAADASALSDDAEFKSDVAKLDGEQVIVGWMDNKAAIDAMTADSAGFPTDDPYTAQLRKNGVGRSVVGVHAAANYVEITGVTTGAPAASVGSPARMATLPDDSIGAAYIHAPGSLVKNGFTGFGLAGQLVLGFPGRVLSGFGGSSETMTASASASAPAYSCPAQPSPPATGMKSGWCEMPPGAGPTSYAPCPPDASSCAVSGTATATSTATSAAPVPDPSPPCTAAHPCSASSSAAAPMPVPSTEEFSPMATQGYEVEVFAPIQGLADQLTGDTTVVLGSLPAPGGKRSPDAAVIGPVADAATAKAAAQKVADAVAKQFEETPSVAVQDGVLTLASDAAYAKKLTGTLGKTELFTTAMGELGGNVQVAVFANLERVRDAASGYPAQWRPVSAIGASLSRDGSDNVLRVRVVSR